MLLLAIPMLLLSCGHRKPNGKFLETVNEKDTTCLKDVAEAEKDFDDGKLTYCHYTGNLIMHRLRSEKELRELLQSEGIDFRNEHSSCIVYEGQTEHCYCDFMQEKIEDKFGAKRLESWLEEADARYLKNHINDTIRYTDCDSRPNYPRDKDNSEDDFSEVLQKRIDQKIRYPKGYVKRSNPDETGFVEFTFYVDKKGNASISHYYFLFDVKSNDRFREFFIGQLDSLIEKQGWTPGKIRGQNVNADMVLRYFFE